MLKTVFALEAGREMGEWIFIYPCCNVEDFSFEGGQNIKDLRSKGFFKARCTHCNKNYIVKIKKPIDVLAERFPQ